MVDARSVFSGPALETFEMVVKELHHRKLAYFLNRRQWGSGLGFRGSPSSWSSTGFAWISSDEVDAVDDVDAAPTLSMSESLGFSNFLRLSLLSFPLFFSDLFIDLNRVICSLYL